MNAVALAVVALVGATIHTGVGAPLRDATLVIEGARIKSVAAGAAAPAGARVIDVSGKVITAGLVAVGTRAGALDIELESSTVEATLPEPADPVRAALRVADTWNPASLTVPIARAGGITAALVVPDGGQISGQAAYVELHERDWLRRGSGALRVALAGPLPAPGAPPAAGGRAAAFLRLREAFADARLYRANRGPFLTNRLRELSVSAADLEVLDRALAREIPLYVEVDRASDIRSALALAREFELRLVIAGGAEAWQVAPDLARADIPVVLDPFANLPSSFASLHARSDSAALLERAGVTLILADLSGPHFAHRLRWAAGNAVADGLPYEAALAAITRTPARVFGAPDTGTLAAGETASLVVWSGDPLDVTSWAERMWIRGQEISLETRQDLLIRRYAR